MPKKPAFKTKYYVVVVENAEPSLDGPYSSFGKRDAVAKKIHNKDNPENVFWLDIREDGPHMGAFTEEFEEEESENLVNATYYSVWSGGVEVSSPCKYNTDSKIVSDIRDSNADVGDNNLENEYVELADGTKLSEADGVTFDY